MSKSSLEILFTALTRSRRATTIRRPGRAPLWAAAERLPAVLAAFPDAIADPPIDVPDSVRRDWTAEDARVAMVRGLMEVCGPITSVQVANQLGMKSVKRRPVSKRSKEKGSCCGAGSPPARPT